MVYANNKEKKFKKLLKIQLKILLFLRAIKMSRKECDLQIFYLKKEIYET